MRASRRDTTGVLTTASQLSSWQRQGYGLPQLMSPRPRMYLRLPFMFVVARPAQGLAPALPLPKLIQQLPLIKGVYSRKNDIARGRFCPVLGGIVCRMER